MRSRVINIPRRCNACSSEDLREFSGELAVHFAGIEGLSKAVVWIFPEVSVCVHCGVAQFRAPDRELRVLRTGIPVDGAAVLMENVEKQYGGHVVDIDDPAGPRPSKI